MNKMDKSNAKQLNKTIENVEYTNMVSLLMSFLVNNCRFIEEEKHSKNSPGSEVALRVKQSIRTITCSSL